MTKQRRILACIGTRPEAIKFRSVLDALEERDVETEVFFTNQSPDLVGEIDADYVMDGRWASLNDGIQRVMFELQHRLREEEPDAVLVQGDTASAFAGALAAFLTDVPVGHVEAGLRTYRRTPWPEEAFRGMIARMARWHFAPDEDAQENLRREMGYSWENPVLDHKDEVAALSKWSIDYGDEIFITGNPIIDTLPSQPFRVLVTLHRRENWGEPIEDALDVLEEFSGPSRTVDIIRHPNWEAQGVEEPETGNWIGVSNPVSHDEFLDWMQVSDVVVTDSGGLQEEAAHFGVDCIVYREATERTALGRLEAVEVVDPSEPERLREALEDRFRKRQAYGSGDAGERIAEILVSELDQNGSITAEKGSRSDERGSVSGVGCPNDFWSYLGQDAERRKITDRMKELADDA